MDLKNKLKQFNKRWNIASAESYEESFDKFKIRILNILEDIDSHVTDEGISLFCQFYGTQERWTYQEYGHGKWSDNIKRRLIEEDNEIEFYKLLEVIFSLDIQTSGGYRGEVTYSKSGLYAEVCQAIDFSDVNLATTVDKSEEIIFYPRGEEFLDNETVNYILSFLNKETNEHYGQALKFYQINKPIKSAESLRRAIEEFLKYKLKNSKGLQSNISELQQKIKGDKRDPQVRNIIFQTFNCLDQYFNENSKHNDGDIDNSENEFLIYQTALLMRYINGAL